ncbi:hypothetical protein EYF80_024071 [Liparis tanakae]|uniref:Uncharacterized protein n=1 Tax=Liparis tanakae TaxID=230148 RepID=A0A4Z2HIR7_9TELE|nr:hypothetical protein EYF80_024071 [Liparis tanakae]
MCLESALSSVLKSVLCPVFSMDSASAARSAAPANQPHGRAILSGQESSYCPDQVRTDMPQVSCSRIAVARVNVDVSTDSR